MSYNEAWREEVLTAEDIQAIRETQEADALDVDGDTSTAKHLWTLGNIRCDGEYMTP